MRVIFFDLDGTLLNAKHQLHPHNVEVVKQLTQRGIKVCLASGRTYTSMRPFYESLNLNTPIISYNGAKIVYPNAEVYESSLSPEIVQELISISREHQVHLNLYQDEIWYTERPKSEEARDYADKAHLSPVARDLYSVATKACTKALFIAPPNRLPTLSSLITDRLGSQVDLTSSMSHFLEVLTRGINKGAAIKQVCEYLAIPLSETMAFGDGLNDLEMIQGVAHGVAMENAHSILKSHADAVAPHHDLGGVANYLTQYLSLTR